MTVLEHVPVTRAGRALVELASCIPKDLLEESLDHALLRRMVSLAELRRRVEEASEARRRGCTALKELLEARDTGRVSESVLETRLMQVLRRAKLPSPVQQYRIRLADGRRVRIDLAYPRELLAIEADGYRWHAGRRSWARDLERRNTLTSAGWRVLHVTWEDVHRRPEQVAGRVAAALDL